MKLSHLFLIDSLLIADLICLIYIDRCSLFKKRRVFGVLISLLLIWAPMVRMILSFFIVIAVVADGFVKKLCPLQPHLVQSLVPSFDYVDFGSKIGEDSFNIPLSIRNKIDLHSLLNRAEAQHNVFDHFSWHFTSNLSNEDL